MTSSITTKVVTTSGRPVPNAVMTVMSDTGEQRAVARSDDSGTAVADQLDTGTYTVVVGAEGYQPTARVAVVTGAGTVNIGQITAVRSGDAPTPTAGHWEIDPGHSLLEISVRHFGISSIRGRFADFTGHIDVPQSVERSSVVAEIKTASIDTDNRTRDEHLRSDAFFDVERHPVATFTAEGVTPRDDEAWTLAGTLTLREHAVPVELELSYQGEVDDPWGGRRAAFQATGTLHRKDFGISFDDTLITGVAQIGGTATITLEVEAVRTGD
ncbi:YceI family protein [Gordonia sp. DT30]|uniref:YceI family protein n=1 Tax=unclassified Gordonia (in: high G+C Gram-positive bacteria) TaxID=2657482 RepID=UPI003CF4D2D0